MLLFDVVRTLVKKMLLMKLVEVDQDVRPYLAALMVAAMAKAGQVLHVPCRLSVCEVPNQEFDELLRIWPASSTTATAYWGVS